MTELPSLRTRPGMTGEAPQGPHLWSQGHFSRFAMQNLPIMRLDGIFLEGKLSDQR